MQLLLHSSVLWVTWTLLALLGTSAALQLFLFSKQNSAGLGWFDAQSQGAGGIILFGSGSDLAVPQGTTNPSNVQGFNNTQSKTNYEDHRVVWSEKPPLGSRFVKGSPGRAQAGTAGPERRGEGQRNLCWPSLPSHQDHKLTLSQVHLVLAVKHNWSKLSKAVSLLVQPKSHLWAA